MRRLGIGCVIRLAPEAVYATVVRLELRYRVELVIGQKPFTGLSEVFTQQHVEICAAPAQNKVLGTLAALGRQDAEQQWEGIPLILDDGRYLCC